MYLRPSHYISLRGRHTPKFVPGHSTYYNNVRDYSVVNIAAEMNVYYCVQNILYTFTF